MATRSSSSQNPVEAGFERGGLDVVAADAGVQALRFAGVPQPVLEQVLPRGVQADEHPQAPCPASEKWLPCQPQFVDSDSILVGFDFMIFD